MQRMFLLVVLMIAVLVGPGVAAAQGGDGDPRQHMSDLNRHVVAARAALDANDIGTVRTEYAAFSDGWFPIEDGVRDASRTSYGAIENAMGDVKYALKQEPVDVADARAALDTLLSVNDEFIAGTGTSSASEGTDAVPTQQALARELQKLDRSTCGARWRRFRYCRR